MIDETRVLPPPRADDALLPREAIGVLWRRRRLIGGASLGAAAVGLLLAFVLPKTFQAQATLLPAPGQGQGSALLSALSGLSSTPLAAALLGGGPSGDLVEILKSRAMEDRVIRAESLKRLFPAATTAQVERTVLGWVRVLPPGPGNSVVAIQVENRDPALAARVANSYVTQLQSMLDSIGYSSASRQRKFLGAQLAKVKTDLGASEKALADFEARSKIASLPETVSSLVGSLSRLEAQQTASQVQLQSTQAEIATMGEAVRDLRTDPNALLSLEVKRQALQHEGRALYNAEERFTDELEKLPPRAMKLATLQRNAKVQEELFVTLTQQYEASLIAEDRESNDFLPLDAAEVPDHPIKPKKLVYALAGLMAGFWGAGAWSLIHDLQAGRPG